jgi:hypothetical protein
VAIALVAPVAELSQGDILAEAPSLYVKSLTYMVKTGDNAYALRRNRPPSLHPERVAQVNAREELIGPDGEDPLGNAVGARRFGMVISHGCEIDKETEHRSVLVAQVRPLRHVTANADSIRSYDQKRTFYLPESAFLGEEAYVDFRAVTTLRIEGVVEDLRRVASLDEDSRMELQQQLFRFFVRRRLPPGWIEWVEEAD